MVQEDAQEPTTATQDVRATFGVGNLGLAFEPV